MNISYNWLKRYIDTDLGAEEVARILTDIGLEVEGFEKIETIKGGLAGVVVGEVLTCEEHPDSDHLHVTTVDVGTGEPLQIVCGAPQLPRGAESALRDGGHGALPRRRRRGIQDQAQQDPRRGIARHALCRGRTGHRSLARRDHGASRRCRGGYDGQGLPPHRGRLPDRGGAHAQPCGCRVAHRRGARPGGLSAQPGGKMFR